nr:gametogenetin-like [Aegilops tauschii subsp. strangulata]
MAPATARRSRPARPARAPPGPLRRPAPPAPERRQLLRARPPPPAPPPGRRLPELAAVSDESPPPRPVAAASAVARSGDGSGQIRRDPTTPTRRCLAPSTSGRRAAPSPARAAACLDPRATLDLEKMPIRPKVLVGISVVQKQRRKQQNNSQAIRYGKLWNRSSTFLWLLV